MKKIPSFLLLVFVLSLSCVDAQEPRPEADPKKVDRDYAIQGEYEGTVGDMKIGVQVIALGNGEFEGFACMGGLPGDGWDGEERMKLTGKWTDDESVFFDGDEYDAVIKDGVVNVTDDQGDDFMELKKVVRESKTLGMKPPEGAIVLFDGTDADAFQKGRMTGDGLLMEGTKSKQLFQSHRLHVEFRTPYKPKARGQGRGNSGVYVQGRYECQVLDSFALAGKHNECGGVYSVKNPDVNMCYPPLTWQTYDIDFTAATFKDGKKVSNARMTVRHNGVLVHDDIEVPKRTTASPLAEGEAPGFLYLQNHGNPVRYRNIWVVETE